MSKPRIVVTFSPSPEIRRALDEILGSMAQVTYLPDGGPERADALASAEVVFAWSIDLELPGEGELGSAAVGQADPASVGGG